MAETSTSRGDGTNGPLVPTKKERITSSSLRDESGKSAWGLCG
jgi:hypothetical protein